MESALHPLQSQVRAASGEVKSELRHRADTFANNGLLVPFSINGKQHSVVAVNGRAIIQAKINGTVVPMYLHTGQSNYAKAAGFIPYAGMHVGAQASNGQFDTWQMKGGGKWEDLGYKDIDTGEPVLKLNSDYTKYGDNYTPNGKSESEGWGHADLNAARKQITGLFFHNTQIPVGESMKRFISPQSFPDILHIDSDNPKHYGVARQIAAQQAFNMPKAFSTRGEFWGQDEPRQALAIRARSHAILRSITDNVAHPTNGRSAQTAMFQSIRQLLDTTLRRSMIMKPNPFPLQLSLLAKAMDKINKEQFPEAMDKFTVPHEVSIDPKTLQNSLANYDAFNNIPLHELYNRLSKAESPQIPDLTDSYNTVLTGDEEKKFGEWKAGMEETGANLGMHDYDIQGAWKAGVKPDGNLHWADSFKKPNHPTFSSYSIYAEQQKPKDYVGTASEPMGRPAGGEWIDHKDNGSHWTFAPSEHVMNVRGPAQMLEYFNAHEKHNNVVLGDTVHVGSQGQGMKDNLALKVVERAAPPPEAPLRNSFANQDAFNNMPLHEFYNRLSKAEEPSDSQSEQWIAPGGEHLRGEKARQFFLKHSYGDAPYAARKHQRAIDQHNALYLADKQPEGMLGVFPVPKEKQAGLPPSMSWNPIDGETEDEPMESDPTHAVKEFNENTRNSSPREGETQQQADERLGASLWQTVKESLMAHTDPYTVSADPNNTRQWKYHGLQNSFANNDAYDDVPLHEIYNQLSKAYQTPAWQRAARMGNSPGPEHDEHGKPTRLLLSLQAWGASSKADAKKKAKAISARPNTRE